MAEAVADELSQTCVAVQGRDVCVGASVGVTILDRHTASERDALAAADRAMYDVKHAARPPAAPRADRDPAAYPVAVPVTLTLRRLGYRIAYRVLQVFWFVVRPPKQGVKCLVTCRDRVLLVRHTYGSHAWDIPGGAMKRNEAPLAAAGREMGEELGLSGVEWVAIGEIRGNVNHRRDTIHCFRVEICEPALTIDRGELASVDWFARSALPDDLAPYVGSVIARAPAIDP